MKTRMVFVFLLGSLLGAAVAGGIAWQGFHERAARNLASEMVYQARMLEANDLGAREREVIVERIQLTSKSLNSVMNGLLVEHPDAEAIARVRTRLAAAMMAAGINLSPATATEENE
ncbi:MAG: hypothetical protein R3217_10380 [Gammaproteobacteria bacterium]|nr:hypothetical protein [Gammaproteobacteria bacterium]